MVDVRGEQVVALKVGTAGFLHWHLLGGVELLPAVSRGLQAVVIVVGYVGRVVLGLGKDVLFYKNALRESVGDKGAYDGFKGRLQIFGGLVVVHLYSRLF